MSKVQVHFFGPINASTVEAFRNMLLNALNAKGCEEIEVLMSSSGGDLNSGFTAYNYLRSVPVKTSIVNMGAIESIAMIPFLGCSERRAVPHSKFLIHNFSWTFPNSPTDINRVAERNSSLMADVERFVAIYDERTAGATDPINARLHLTGPAAVISVPAAIRAAILTSEDDSFPVITQPAMYDRLLK